MPFIEAVAIPDVIPFIISLALLVLIVGVSGASSKSKSSGSSTAESGTKFPWEILQYGGQYFGKPPTMDDLARMVPSTSGLFGGTTGMYQPQSQQPAAASPQNLTDQALTGNQVGISDIVKATAQQQGQQGQPSQQAPVVKAKTFTMADFAGTIQGDNHWKYRVPIVTGKLIRAGYDPNNFTAAQLQEVTQGDPDILIGKGVKALSEISTAEQSVMQQQASPWASQTVAPGVGAALPSGMAGSIANLGFGQTPQTYTQREVGAAPTVSARGISDIFTPGGRERLSNEMFEAQYLPVERRLNLEQQQADRALNAQLAQAGLASSGTGIGQRAQQGLEYTRERAAAAKEAAANAAAQAQQMRLEASGIDVQAQTANAQNILQGNIANADNYLRAIGLSQNEAQLARQSFLDLLGLQEQDLQRMDQSAVNALTAMMEPYLAEWGIMAGVGQYQISTESSSKTGKSGAGGVSFSGPSGSGTA